MKYDDNIETLNKFKITVKTEVDDNFKYMIKNYINKEELCKKHEIKRLGQTTYYIRGDFFPLFTLTVSNILYFTFDFKGISMMQQYYYPDISKKKEKVKFDEITSFCANKDLILKRIDFLKRLLRFLKVNGFYPKTLIKSIGFSSVFYGLEKWSDSNFKLLKFYSKAKSGEFYEIYSLDRKYPILTVPFKYYKAFLGISKVTINKLKTYNKGNHMYYSESETQQFINSNNIETIEEEIVVIQKKIDILFSSFNEKEVSIDTNGSLWLYLDKVSYEKTNKDLYFCNKLLKFKQVIDSNSKFFTLRTVDSKLSQMYYNKCNDKGFGILSREKSIVSFEVNGWTSTKLELLKKYKATKKHRFTLADNIEDITAYILNFKKSFVLINDIDSHIIRGIRIKSPIILKKFIEEKEVKEYLQLTQSRLSLFLEKLLNLI